VIPIELSWVESQRLIKIKKLKRVETFTFSS